VVQVNVDNMENTRKLKSSDILKPGAKLKARILDFNDPEVKRMLDAVMEEKRKCLARKNINWGDLDKIYINI
jgi:hypothetical protein